MIRKLLLASAAAGGLAAAMPASAADLAVRPAPAPAFVAPVVAPVPVFTWTGWYIGGNAGGKWGKFSGGTTAGPFDDVVPNGDVFAFDTGYGGGAFLGGGQIGFNWQTGPWVFGVEGDFEGTNVKHDITLGADPGGGAFVAGDTFRFKNDWQASVRARGGIAFDRWLVYATGGVAWAGVKADAFISPGFVGNVAVPGAFASDRHTLVGGTVGGGVEFALMDNVTLGVEYRYSDFGSETFNLGIVPLTAGGGVGPGVTSDVKLQTHEVTARLNFKFGSLFGWP